MAKYVHKSKYFYGNEISEYGLKNGYVDYSTLAKSFDAVLNNDITKLFYASVNTEYSEGEQINGYVDNSNEIEELQERVDELNSLIWHSEQHKNKELAREYKKELEELENEIQELEYNQQPEIFQYFIINERGAEILQDLTNEVVFYLPIIDAYVWGVDHYGTSWDYVLTDIKIELDEE